MGITNADLARLRCPIAPCDAQVDFAGSVGAKTGFLESGVLTCRSGAHHAFGVRGGIPFLVSEADVSGMDAILRPIYDMIAPVHDAGVKYMLAALQFPDPRARRQNYIAKLEFGGLARGPGEEKPRILEVGIGAGANVHLIDAALPVSQDAEIWGVDLSSGMLDEARRRLEGRPDRVVRLALADAHALPFADSTFDRVFSVGCANGYRNPKQALAEMARVAKPGTPIVVVDEELDPKRDHLPLHRVLFRALTAYDANPHAPLEAVPDGATACEVTPVSRFYYCLCFRMPAPPRERPPLPAAGGTPPRALPGGSAPAGPGPHA